MAFALGVLRLSPNDFWNMTLPEIYAAIRGFKGDFGTLKPFARDNLEELIKSFPDEK